MLERIGFMQLDPSVVLSFTTSRKFGRCKFNARAMRWKKKMCSATADHRNTQRRKDAKTQAHSTHQAALSEYFDLTLDAKRNLMKLCAFIFKPSSYYSMIFFAGTLVATTTVAFVFVMRTILKELDIKPSLPSLPSINLPFKKRSVQTANI